MLLRSDLLFQPRSLTIQSIKNKKYFRSISIPWFYGIWISQVSYKQNSWKKYRNLIPHISLSSKYIRTIFRMYRPKKVVLNSYIRDHTSLLRILRKSYSIESLSWSVKTYSIEAKEFGLLCITVSRLQKLKSLKIVLDYSMKLVDFNMIILGVSISRLKLTDLLLQFSFNSLTDTGISNLSRYICEKWRKRWGGNFI